MEWQPRKHRKDYRFEIARKEPIDPTHAELARALLAEENEFNAPQVLRELRKLSINRRKSKQDTGPYLDVREEEGRRNKIVVIDGRSWESTRYNAVDGEVPEDNPDALIYLKGYVRRANMTIRRTVCPEDILLSTVLDEYIDAFEPDAIRKGPVAGMSPEEIRLSEGDPKIWHRQQKNARKQLKQYFEGKTLADINPDSGKNYKKDKQKTAKLVGGEGEGGEIVPPKDGTIRMHLYMFQRAINWFLDIHKIPLRWGFDMPDFDEPEAYALEWEQYIRVKLVCRGLQPVAGGFKTKSVVVDGKKREVWDKDFLAPRASLRAAERVVETYFSSGTRLRTIFKMTWSPSDINGYFDPDFIHRNGKRSKRHKEKPRESSEMFPYFAKRVSGWRRHDAPVYAHLVPDDRRPSDYVIHDGAGNPVPDLEELMREIFKRAGIEARRHDLKHTGVTIHYKRGVAIGEMSNRYGTTERTLRKTYLRINWSRDKIAAGSEIKSLKDLGGNVKKFLRVGEARQPAGHEPEAAARCPETEAA